MLSVLEDLLVVASLAMAVPVAMFCLEVFCALIYRRRQAEPHLPANACVVVLVPAHNEAAVIGPTLRALMPTLPSAGRVLVVADNCTDATATTARQLGAEVVERHDPLRRGKGFALDFGIRHLERDAPDAVVFLDADCRVAENTVVLLAAAALHRQRPVQAQNLCEAAAPAGALQLVSCLAFRFKNLVRARGLSQLAGIAHLSGTGMALPWQLARQAKLASAHLAEDMQLGVDLAVAGRPALFLPEASVQSPLPTAKATARTQRTRWEHGHLKIAGEQIPRLFSQAIRQRRLDLLWLALDLTIPPLALLATALAALLALTVTTWLLGSSVIPLLIAGTAILLLNGATLAGWAIFCRQQVPLVALLAAPLYIAAKLPMYVAFIFKRQREWVRTERDPVAS